MTTDVTIAPTRQGVCSELGTRQIGPYVISRLRVLSRNAYARAFTAYAVLALIANLPSWPGNPNRIATCLCGGYSDPNQTAWFLMWTPFALLHGHNPFFSTYVNYPFGVNLSQNTSMPLLGLLTSPLTLLANPVASMNLLRWLAFLLSAFSAFCVIRRFVHFVPAAFVGGLLYGFSPYMVTQGSVHLDLAFAPLPPILLYGIFELTVQQKSSPLRWGVITGLCAAAQFYISVEVLATTAIVASIGVFFMFFLCIRQVPSHFQHAITGLVVASAITGVVCGYPIWVMFRGPKHYVGPAQGYNEVYNADLLGPILPTVAQLVAPKHLAAMGTNLVGGKANIDENGSYLGIPLIAITVYFVGRYWRRLWMPFLGLMALTVFSLSLGPRLYIDGKKHHLPFNLPFRKLSHLPGINNVLPVRFSLYVMFFVAVIVALGIDYYREDFLARKTKARHGDTKVRTPSLLIGRTIGAVVALAAVVALIPHWPYSSRDPQLYFAETPAGTALIPTGSAVLTYPYATPFSDDAMLWQALAGMRFKVFGSYALIPGKHKGATTFPPTLQPSIVEAMLANSITAVPDPTLPPVVATTQTVIATTVEVLPRGIRRPSFVPGGTTGIVQSIARHSNVFFVDTTPTVPVAIDITSSTRYIEPYTRKPSWKLLSPGYHVVVYGRIEQGSINSENVRLLQQFVANNHVNAIDIELGRRDSAAIVMWMKLAFGQPTRAGGGGEFWIRPAARRTVASA